MLRDGPNGTCRLWYRSFHDGRPESDRNFLNYAESSDGLPGAGDRHGALKDPVTGEYVVFTRSPRYKARARGRDDPDTAPLP